MEFDLRREGSYWLGNYDQWIFDRVNFRRHVPSGTIAWDCGAYIGYYTAVLRKLIGDGGAVIAFEASVRNYRRLACLPDLNAWSNVFVHHLAVGPEHTTMKFIGNLGGSSGPYGMSKQYGTDIPLDIEIVESCGVDQLVFERGIPAPDFIKFDLETAEEYALHNGRRIFSEKRPVLLLELHGVRALSAAGKFLSEYQYEACDVSHLPEPEGRVARCSTDTDAWGYVPHMLLCVPGVR